ncbi:MAG: (deoxy)nucleoside triphosphate pyrophosphohydrolase [Eggerthellaceae bacterium]|jgi:8-oxo-dGTP diphosphatase
MKTVDVVAAIIVHEGKIFATQRGYGEFKDGWEFPGGKVEPGETPEQALVREIHEELDCSIEIERHFCTVDYDYPTFHLHMGCYLAHVSDGAPKLLEHEAARWLGASTLDSVDWLPADLQIIDQLKAERIAQ